MEAQIQKEDLVQGIHFQVVPEVFVTVIANCHPRGEPYAVRGTRLVQWVRYGDGRLVLRRWDAFVYTRADGTLIPIPTCSAKAFSGKIDLDINEEHQDNPVLAATEAVLAHFGNPTKFNEGFLDGTLPRALKYDLATREPLNKLCKFVSSLVELDPMLDI